MVIIGGAVAAMGALPYGLGWIFGQNKVPSIDFSDSCCAFNEREFVDEFPLLGCRTIAWVRIRGMLDLKTIKKTFYPQFALSLGCKHNKHSTFRSSAAAQILEVD